MLLVYINCYVLVKLCVFDADYSIIVESYDKNNNNMQSLCVCVCMGSMCIAASPISPDGVFIMSQLSGAVELQSHSISSIH